MTEPVRLVGVDLGQQRDYTAISITERVLVPTEEFYREPYYSNFYGETLWRSAQEGSPEYQVRHLERPPLGTRYTEIVDRIVELVTQLGGRTILAVDATGVGLPVKSTCSARECGRSSNARTPMWSRPRSRLPVETL